MNCCSLELHEPEIPDLIIHLGHLANTETSYEVLTNPCGAEDLRHLILRCCELLGGWRLLAIHDMREIAQPDS